MVSLMSDIPLILVLIAIFIALAAGVLAGLLVARKGSSGDAEAMASEREEVVNAALGAVRQERGESMRQTLDTVMSVASSKLGEQMAAGKQVLDREHLVVAAQVDGVQSELRRVGELIASMQQDRAEQDGRLTTRLDQAVAVTTTLADTTRSLREALASPKARGQWGERMAEDVLRAAGFKEGMSYKRQVKIAGGGIPDYTFLLPKGHAVHMDVKFPIDNYLRWLECDGSTDSETHIKAFRRDVRQRVSELGGRAYIDPATTVDYMLLFIPNESVYGFLHEHDSDLVDFALGKKVVLCSPTSLFAVLAVIRQAVDNFLVERRSDEILAKIGGLREQWDKFGESIEKVNRGLSSAQNGLDDLAGARSRAFEKKLDELEIERDGRMAELGDSSAAGAADTPSIAETPALRQVG